MQEKYARIEGTCTARRGAHVMRDVRQRVCTEMKAATAAAVRARAQKRQEEIDKVQVRP